MPLVPFNQDVLILEQGTWRGWNFIKVLVLLMTLPPTRTELSVRDLKFKIAWFEKSCINADTYIFKICILPRFQGAAFFTYIYKKKRHVRCSGLLNLNITVGKSEITFFKCESFSDAPKVVLSQAVTGNQQAVQYSKVCLITISVCSITHLSIIL